MPDLTPSVATVPSILTVLTTLTMLTAGLVGVVTVVKEGEAFSNTVVFGMGHE